MAAYGSIARTTSVNTTLHPTVWHTEAKEGRPVHTCTIHHLTLETARHLPELISFLSSTFAQVVEDGMTYPQEGPIDQPSFESYFFAGDVFIGISIPTTDVDPTYDLIKMEDGSSIETGYGPDMARGGRTWEQSVTGFYYVKPNYPGRSSHICNGGFVVPPSVRGYGHGFSLAKSYVHYAPLLGYQASVFNLVYVNNVASVALWERLGFTKAGLIPRAGRLKKKDGDGEEYIDAWVFYKSFESN